MCARHRERGQVLPLIALCLAVLMGFAGVAVDVGYWEYQQREQQNAAECRGSRWRAAAALQHDGLPESIRREHRRPNRRRKQRIRQRRQHRP